MTTINYNISRPYDAKHGRGCGYCQYNADSNYFYTKLQWHRNNRPEYGGASVLIQMHTMP